MIILIILIVTGIMFFCEYKYKNDNYSMWDISRFLTIPCLCVSFIAFLLLLHGLIRQRIIDEQIKLYSKQNKEIENKIEITVKQYMEYENNTFSNLKASDYINLVNLYPELKADNLVQKQMDLYLENNEKIIELKEEKINKTLYKWWLFFGK